MIVLAVTVCLLLYSLDCQQDRSRLSRKEKLQYDWCGIGGWIILYSAFMFLVLLLIALLPSGVLQRMSDTWSDIFFISIPVVPLVASWIIREYIRSRIDAMPDEEDDEWY